LSILERNSIEFSNADIIASLQISDKNPEGEVESLSTSELDEILKTFPVNLINREEDQSSNLIIDLDFQNSLMDPQQITNDDLFVEMLLNSDYSSPSSTTETIFDDLLFPDVSSSSFSLPRITSVDEFDAFLRDFTHNLSSHQQEVLTPIS